MQHSMDENSSLILEIAMDVHSQPTMHQYFPASFGSNFYAISLQYRGRNLRQ